MSFNQIVIDDYDLLVQNENFGIYTQCEVIEIFGFKDEKAFNIYTLIIFEDSIQALNKTEYLTNGLVKLTKDVKFGIRRHTLDLNSIRKVFIDLVKTQIFSLLPNQLSELNSMSFKAKQFAEPDSTFDVQINKILKNNFHNGSYIIEGFDVSKENVAFLFHNNILEKFNAKVMEICPINLMALTDRIGNVVFQFPSNILNHEVMTDKEEKNIFINIFWNTKVIRKPKISFSAFSRHDKVITGFTSMSNISDNETLKFTSENMIDYYVYNEDNNLILASKTFTTINSINMNGSISSPQPRVFKINNQLQRVQVGSSFMNNIIGNSDKNNVHWIQNRLYEKDLKTAEKDKSFIQYFSGSREKALHDIRELIVKYGKGGVYLWDPYLNALDIKNTLYFSTFSHAPLRAISGLKQQNNKFEEMLNMRQVFEEDDTHYLFLNLEVRGTYIYGNDFHDRFLLFPQAVDEKPKVWSLGISVNQLGESHHIFQEIKNAQPILDAFNEAWEELNHEESVIWKSI